MAISKQNFTDVEGSIKITNGDFRALKEIAKAYGIKEESDVIAFALGILSEANGKPIAIQKEDGNILKFLPADSLQAK